MRLTSLAIAVLLASHGRLAAEPQALPDTPGPLELNANPVTAGNPIPQRTLGVTPVYPPEAYAIGATGRVSVRVTLDELGRVVEVRRPLAPALVFPSSQATTEQLAAAVEALLTATANAVRQWQYDPPAQPPVSFNVTVAFTPSAEPSLVSQNDSPERGRERTAIPRPPLPISQLEDSWAEGAVRIGRGVAPPVKTRHVSPVYPPAARDAGVEGIVIIETRIGEDGRVTKSRVLHSAPGLDHAALDAVAQWEYRPARIDGRLTPVVMTITMKFSLPR